MTAYSPIYTFRPLFILLFGLFFIAFPACSSTHQIKEDNTAEIQKSSEDGTQEYQTKYRRDEDLTMHLRKINGVRVRGDGPSATITIRGGEVSSFNANTTPLFVIDGQTVNNSYSAIYNMVNSHQIKRIEVLKGADAAGYGIRGANGVIIIDLQ